MIINIPSYKFISESQSLDLSDKKICTFIGGNGSGKSTLLESIFKDNNGKTISFSSGQNELFSKIYNDIKSTTFKKIQQIESSLEDIKKYHFDYDYSRILVFLALSLKNGLVKNYLLNTSSYISSLDNIKMEIDFQLPLYYINAYSDAIEKEALDPEYYSVRKTYIHTYLEKIVERKINEQYDFDNKINKTLINLTINDLLSIFEDKDPLKIFTFISLTNNASVPIFDYKSARLLLGNNLEFEELSDGEYQLLSIYAIIDLFDDTDTLFLFDEIDSHLHYTNLKKMWTSLNQINGKIISTTHISESILNNSFENLHYIDEGKIKKELTAEEVSKKLESIVGEKKYTFKVASRIKNIALLDDLDDWIIFKKLARKKLGDEVDDILNRVTAFKRESSFDTANEIFGKSKMIYVQDFKKINEYNPINTKNLFLICDRDNLPLSQINDNLEVNIHRDYSQIKSFNSNNTKTHLLSWTMLEIENYLLSKTMLSDCNKLNDLKNERMGVNFDNLICCDESEDLRTFDAKEILHPLYKEQGLNEVELDEIIDKIPANEISEDIVKMYNFIKEKLNDGN